MTQKLLTRRNFLHVGTTAAIAGIGYAGYRAMSAPGFLGVLESAEYATLNAQRALLVGQPLAREFSPSDMSPVFKANGTTHPGGVAYQEMLAANFSNWRLRVDGLVANPMTLSLADLKRMPQRTQITRHDCVEGWSAIGKWQGPQLSFILDLAGLKQEARYIVFHCADRFGTTPYYESIDLVDAFHPQTILAWRMNGQPLPEAHGAPLRLRVERQLGYKQAKYVMRIEARATLAGLHGGKGGYWEDHSGYAWHAGI